MGYFLSHDLNFQTRQIFSPTLNRGFASESKTPGRMIVMDFITNVFEHFDLDVKKGPTPYLGLTQLLRAVLGTPLILLLEE